MKNFVVINADIKASRKLRDLERYEWQLFLKSAIVQINENYRPAVEADFMITKGDEFQGVLNDLARVNEIMLFFERLVYPLRLRFGVGYGLIQKMGSQVAIEMDGPAFHLASSALSTAKKKKVAVYVKTQNTAFDLSMNTIYQLLYSIKNRWHEIAYKRYWKYKELGTFKLVAEQEGVSTQAVWDSLNSSGALEALKVEQTLDQLFKLRQLTNHFSGTKPTASAPTTPE